MKPATAEEIREIRTIAEAKLAGLKDRSSPSDFGRLLAKASSEIAHDIGIQLVVSYSVARPQDLLGIDGPTALNNRPHVFLNCPLETVERQVIDLCRDERIASLSLNHDDSSVSHSALDSVSVPVFVAKSEFEALEIATLLAMAPEYALGRALNSKRSGEHPN